MADNGYGYDPVTGLNSGDLDFQSLQGTMGGQNYYAPVPFSNAGQSGYIDFGSQYNPAVGSGYNTDYLYYGNYGEALAASNPTHGAISYGSAQENSLAGTPGNGDPMINGIDYTQGASYANMAANGQGTYTAPGIGVASSGGTASNGLTPYTQYTDPTYEAPTATQAGPTGLQSYAPDGSPLAQGQSNATAFLYGNNGSQGSVYGTFTNNTPGQSAGNFYATEPGSLTQGDPSANLGQFQTLNPANPALQALTNQRSLN